MYVIQGEGGSVLHEPHHCISSLPEAIGVVNALKTTRIVITLTDKRVRIGMTTGGLSSQIPADTIELN